MCFISKLAMPTILMVGLEFYFSIETRPEIISSPEPELDSEVATSLEPKPDSEVDASLTR